MCATQGRFWRGADQLLNYSIDKVEACQYAQLCQQLAGEFHLRPVTKLIDGLDVIMQDYTDGIHTIGLEWDVWSGFMVGANSPESEALVHKLAEYLTGRNNDLTSTPLP